MNALLSMMKNLYPICLFTFVLFIASCDNKDPVITEEDKLINHISGHHFDYYYSDSDPDYIDTAWQEEYYDWLIDALELSEGITLEYYKYRDRAHLKRVTGENTNGFAEVGTTKFHTIWEIDNHECVHSIVTQLIGHPPALFNEGIAVAHQADYFKYPEFIPGWNGQDFHSIAKTHYLAGELPSLNKLLVSNSSWEEDADLTYPVAGSFVRYLIDQYGIGKLKSFITSSDYDDGRESIKSDFSATYGITMEQAWNEWEVFVEEYVE